MCRATRGCDLLSVQPFVVMTTPAGCVPDGDIPRRMVAHAARERDEGHDQDRRDQRDEQGASARPLRPPQMGSRSTGQVMQWPPPRPLPSSNPSIVMTSTPASRILEIVNVLRS